jgi:hypothetical protein
MWLVYWLSPYVSFLAGAVFSGAFGNHGRSTTGE